MVIGVVMTLREYTLNCIEDGIYLGTETEPLLRYWLLSWDGQVLTSKRPDLFIDFYEGYELAAGR